MKSYHKIPLIYLVISWIWILVSDRVVESIATTPGYITQIQTYKGWFFVILSGLLIYYLTRRACLREQSEEFEKRELFKGTMRGSYHIILNYLNQMQLIHMEAERSTDFDKDLLKTAEKVSKEVVDELHHLEKLNVADSSDIERFLQQQMMREHERDGKADA